MSKRTASQRSPAPNRPGPGALSARYRSTSSRIFDPSSVTHRAEANRLDPIEEQQRIESSEKPTDVEILRYEDGLENEDEEWRVSVENNRNEVDAETPVSRPGVVLEALADLGPDMRDLLRQNQYIRALVQYIQMAVWFPTQDAVRSHLLGAGLEVERVDRMGRWLCSPALQEEKHMLDDVKLSQVEIEQRRAQAEKEVEADVEYTLSQLAHRTGDLTFEEKEEIEGIIEDELQVVVEIEERVGFGLRICKWRVGVA